MGRLQPPYGQAIDRDQTIHFQFEGHSLQAFAGDSVASALLANDEFCLQYSRYLKRPRGLFHLAEPDDRMIDGAVLSRQQTPLQQQAKTQIGFPQTPLSCDIAIVGAGPAGLAAALSAADQGAEVILFEAQPLIGGSLRTARFENDNHAARDILTRLASGVRRHKGIRVFTQAVVASLQQDRGLMVKQGSLARRVSADHVILANGVIEQPLVFRNNDVPGIMTGSTAQILMTDYAIRLGRQAIVVTAHDYGYGVALDLADAGMMVQAIVDMRQKPEITAMRKAAAAREIKIFDHSTVYAAKASGDGTLLSAVRLATITSGGHCEPYAEDLACDCLCLSVGCIPQTRLAQQAGAEIRYDAALASLVIEALPHGLSLAGAIAHYHRLSDVISSAVTAGEAAAHAIGKQQGTSAYTDLATKAVPQSVSHDNPIFSHLMGNAFVDFDSDLTVSDVEKYNRRGLGEAKHIAQWTPLSQNGGTAYFAGHLAATNLIRLVAKLQARAPAQMAMIDAASPGRWRLSHWAKPATMLYHCSVTHDAQIQQQAHFVLRDQWWQAQYYGAERSEAEIVSEEVTCVRQQVGLIDGSFIAGWDLRGTRIQEFVGRHLRAAKSLQAGRLMKTVLMDGDGWLIDEVIITRLDQEHYYLTASMACRRTIGAWLDERAKADGAEIDIEDVSDTYAVIQLTGPKARKILGGLSTLIDFTSDGFPKQRARQGKLEGVDMRILRTGLLGELCFELHLPAIFGHALWLRLTEVGANDGLRPIGFAARDILRLEKGQALAGIDTPRLARRRAAEPLVGFVLAHGADIPQPGQWIIEKGQYAGYVTSAALSPTLSIPIGLARVKPDLSVSGSTLSLYNGSRQGLSATVTSLPFYDAAGRRQEF